MYKCFFHFELLASNTIKNETEKKLKSLLGKNLLKYSSEFLAHLGHTCTTTSLVIYLEITRNISCREKFFNPKICWQVFRINPIYFFHYLPFYFRLNKTGNEAFSEWTESYR